MMPVVSANNLLRAAGFFSVVARGSYVTCSAPFAIVTSRTLVNAVTASVISF